MKIRKLSSIILMILGIAIFVSLTVFDTLHDYRLWSINDSGKAEQFPAFMEYWWETNIGTTILSFVQGAIPFSIGARLRKK